MDHYFFQLINGFAGKIFWLDKLGIFFAQYLGYILAVSVIIIFWKKWKIIFQVFSAAILARLGIVELIRLFWERPRPFVGNNVHLLFNHSAAEPAFPSGHAAFFFALAAAIYFHNKKIGLLFFLAAFLISISRVFAGVHWPLDIIAGAIVGVFSGWLVAKIFRKF